MFEQIKALFVTESISVRAGRTYAQDRGVCRWKVEHMLSGLQARRLPMACRKPQQPILQPLAGAAAGMLAGAAAGMADVGHACAVGYSSTLLLCIHLAKG